MQIQKYDEQMKDRAKHANEYARMVVSRQAEKKLVPVEQMRALAQMQKLALLLLL